MTIKVHHLRPAAGRQDREDPGGSRRGRQGQDGRSRHQGHEGPQDQVAGQLRGRPDAAAHAAAEAQGLQATGSGSSTRSSTSADLGRLFPDGGDGRRRRSWSTAGRRRARQPVKVLGNGDLGGRADRQRARVLRQSPREKITAAGGSVTSSRPAVSVRRWPRRRTVRRVRACRTALQPRRVLRTWRTVRREPRRRRLATRAGGSLLSAFASALTTPDLRKKILFTLGDGRGLPARRRDPDAGRVVPATSRQCICQVEGGPTRASTR